MLKLQTIVLWTTGALIALLGMLAIAAAAVVFVVTLGPFYVIGELAEWIRNRGQRKERGSHG